MRSLLMFHHNLAFSSIPEEQRREVIDKCYMPLLDFVDQTSTKINLEAPAWTLLKCHEVCPEYIDRLRHLIQDGLIEFVGSGYCQLIGPLVPYEINRRNQAIGLKYYQALLGCRPETLLINEMSFSAGLLDSIKAAGYRRIIMDADNIALASGLSSKVDLRQYDFISNSRDAKVEVVWSDSVLFQKFQRVIHGGISINEYINYVSLQKENNPRWLPIYTNDVEIFNFRPGRFKEEAAIAKDEWGAIGEVVAELKAKLNLDFQHIAQSEMPVGKTLYLDRCEMPVAVKKQPKYNITRWAVTGRSDSELNAYCYSELKNLKSQSAKACERKWERLCYLWSSDFRTHIHESRWAELEGLLDAHRRKSAPLIKSDVLEQEKMYGRHKRVLNEELVTLKGSALSVKTSKVRMTVNLAKGGAIEEAGFKEHGFKVSIGSFQHGVLDEINHAADFYSGGILVEDFDMRQRHTDYKTAEPEISFDEGYVNLLFRMHVGEVALEKRISVGLDTEEIKLEFRSEEFPSGHRIIRLGNFLFMNDDNEIHVETETGGSGSDLFVINGEFDHTANVSSFVSARTGFCSPEERLKIVGKTHRVQFEWDNSIGYLFPMMKHSQIGGKFFTRLLFSKSELDDTSRKRAANLNASLVITSCKDKVSWG